MGHAICVLRDKNYKSHGTIKISELPEYALQFKLDLKDLPEGLHGFHLHSSGDELHAPDSFCSHYNPDKNNHGDRNDTNAHRGDFGNIRVDRTGKCQQSFAVYTLTYPEIIGRSLIIHEDEDDLGRGIYEDSLTTGHSGKRLLFGIVGVDDCQH
jgi:Cu-Zn family superoxide dismutase